MIKKRNGIFWDARLTLLYAFRNNPFRTVHGLRKYMQACTNIYKLYNAIKYVYGIFKNLYLFFLTSLKLIKQ